MADHKKRALVVDDDDPIRTMLAKVVERQGLTVDVARDGAEAIELLDADGYTLVLLDLMMPRVDGFAVLRHMNEHYPEKLHCTIVATAIPESEVVKKFEIPLYRIHVKPFDMQTLIEDIQNCADTQQRRRPSALAS